MHHLIAHIDAIATVASFAFYAGRRWLAIITVELCSAALGHGFRRRRPAGFVRF